MSNKGRRVGNRIFLQLHIMLGIAALQALLFSNCPLLAQQVSLPENRGLVRSMGFPRIWKPYLGPTIAWERRGLDGEAAGEINLGVYKDLVNPVIGAVGIAGEGYVSGGGDKVDGGVRFLGVSRIFFMQGGVDYSLRNNDVDFLMSFTVPLRRGGPLGKGGNLRIDWFPGRNHSFSVGLSIPLGQPFMGKTRPPMDHVQLPGASCQDKSIYIPDPELQEALGHIWHAAKWINHLTIPFLDQSAKKGKSDIAAFREKIKQFKSHIQLKDDLYPRGHTFKAEVNVYHQELERAFSLAVREGQDDDSQLRGALISVKAREILLDEVIIPYNRLLGQRKKHDSVLGFGCRATEMFEGWVSSSFDISADNLAGVMYVFRSLLKCIDKNRSASKDVWEDSRLVWIPMHYALRFEDHDTEDELDAIIEKAVGEKFTDANDVHYVINELFQPELVRMIQAAQDYHVLWIHDFSGENKTGDPDGISLQIVEAYIQALTEKVGGYEANRKI